MHLSLQAEQSLFRKRILSRKFPERWTSEHQSSNLLQNISLRVVDIKKRWLRLPSLRSDKGGGRPQPTNITKRSNVPHLKPMVHA